MAKLDKMPQRQIIDGYKGTLDFYYWKGIPVCRKWPIYIKRTPTPIELTYQQAFSYINKLWAQLPLIIQVQLTLFAARSTLTGKDFLVRGYLKGLFEIMPPEYYATEQTLLLLLAQLDVALSTRALEAGGNLETIKDDIILLKDLRDALSSIATKRLQVEAKGADKIFSFESIVEGYIGSNTLAAGQNIFDSAAVPANKVWNITLISMHYIGTVPTSIRALFLGLAGNLIAIFQPAPASGQYYVWSGNAHLKAADKLRFVVDGATLNDDAWLRFAGTQTDAP